MKTYNVLLKQDNNADTAEIRALRRKLEISKSESIKEFAKELIYKLNGIPQYHFNLLMVCDVIKNTVKEMTEGENG